MSDPNETVAGDNAQDKMKSLEERLTKTVVPQAKEAAESQLMARLLQDSDFRAVLQAKQQKKSGRFLTDDEIAQLKQAPPEKEPTQDDSLVDADTGQINPKKLVKHMTSSLERLIDQKLSKTVGPLSEKLDHAYAVIEQESDKRARQLVDDAKKQFEDFEDYKPAMVALNDAFGGHATPDELYIIAKKRAGKTINTEKRTESERPINTPARPPKKPVVETGRRGMRELIGNALQGVDFSDVTKAAGGR